MSFTQLLNDYSLIAVLVGTAVCILTGIIKLPIKNALNKKLNSVTDQIITGTGTPVDQTEVLTNVKTAQKKYNDLFKDLCLLIAVFLSAVGILLYHVFTHTLYTFTTLIAYREIMTSYIVSELVFMMYEKVGLKTLSKNIINTIRTKAKEQNNAQIDDVLTIIEKILEDDVKLPLTTTQQNLLREKYTEKTTQHK